MQWPPDYLEEFQRRARMLGCANTPKDRGALLVHYKHNPVDFINDWCVTYDPRKKSPEPKLMPFKLFPRQEEFVHFLQDCLDDNEGGLVEKARDIGASWICCAFSVWLWTFHDGVTIGWGSRKEEYVDKKGDPKAIFPKIRQIIDNLPVWMKPQGYSEQMHGTYMKIVNPVTGSVITGEAGDNIGRGGRTTIFFKDESAHYERPELIEAALGDNTDVQVDISSVNGTNNVFYRRRMSGVEWERGKEIETGITRVFVFDWRDHPAKTQEWYDQRRAKAEREGLLHVFKQEVDRDYTGSQDKVIIPQEWIKASIDAHKKLDIKIVGQTIAGQDIADGGGDKNAIVIRKGILAMYGSHWGGEAGEAAKVAVPICNKHKVVDLYYDCIGVGSAFKTQINTMKEFPTWNAKLMVHKWDAGAAVKHPHLPSIKGDPDSPKNGDVYHNFKAQAWYNVRQMFYKTYRAVVHGDEFEDDDLICIDSNMEGVNQLQLELSQVKERHTQSGKVVIDKKPNGATSPNLADAFVMCYNPVKSKVYESSKASDYF
jgi:hypothetical protein